MSVSASSSSIPAPIRIWYLARMCSSLKIHAPASVNSVNVATRPATIAYGRRRVPDDVPPARMIGSTGRMHGVNAVISPAANAMGIKTAISSSY